MACERHGGGPKAAAFDIIQPKHRNARARMDNLRPALPRAHLQGPARHDLWAGWPACARTTPLMRTRHDCRLLGGHGPDAVTVLGAEVAA